MFLLDKPYVSDFLKETIKKNTIPVIDVTESQEFELLDGTYIINRETAIEIAKTRPIIYTNSENAINWISENLSFTDIPQKIELFKDKYKFRELTASLYPDFFYKKIQFQYLDTLDISSIPLPFIIKPSVGFFSLGVYRVNTKEEWNRIKGKIQKGISKSINLYPHEVLNYSTFIIEQCIIGEEFAIDMYFDSNSEPVILNILQHTFSSNTDVSDRMYTSSKMIIQSNIKNMEVFLKKIGLLAKVKNFPCHVELRKDENGTLIPIEINPMRFGGWCTTPDFTFYAYGINSYLYFYNQQKPNWDELLQDKGNKIYSLIVLGNSTGIDACNISSFNYQKLLNDFENPLELRKLDHKIYSVFGFLFTETDEKNVQELENILNSDLKKYINTI